LALSDCYTLFVLNKAKAQGTLSFFSSQMKFFEGFNGTRRNREHMVADTIGNGLPSSGSVEYRGGQSLWQD
jgi:hypothetical protein